MIRTASLQDLPPLRELFERSNDAPYDLASVAEEKCFGGGVAGDPVVRVAERDRQILGAAVTCGKWLRILAVHRESRRRGIGSALLADAERHGATAIAAEAGNYFTPGVALSDEASLAFFKANGYVQGAATTNLDVSLEEWPTERFADAIIRPSHEEAANVLSFIDREFGRIWRFEATKAFERDVPSIFVAIEDRAITGFAVHDVNNRGLGFFGPTGVARSMRGRGIGCRLLRASLQDLRVMGYRRAVIPWTDATDFYRKCCGAEPAHRFVAFAKPRP